MSLYLAKVAFRTPVRLGAPGRDDQSGRESIQSDQFFSWVSLGWIRLFGLEHFEKNVLQPFRSGNHPWIHSDLFPSDSTIWLPAPRLAVATKDGSEPQPKKKQLSQWLTYDAFLETLASKNPPPLDSYGRPVEVTLMTNVRIKRGDERDNEPYYTAATVAAGGDKESTTFTGFIRSENSDLMEQLESVLEFVADEGLGGNRSTGLGTIERISLSAAGASHKGLENGAGNCFVILSACYPTQNMISQLEKSDAGSNNYALNWKAGWIYDHDGKATHIRKPTTYTFSSGSSFSFEPEGQLVDVGASGYAAYKYAIPFVVRP